jgi:hypothetical protein
MGGKELGTREGPEDRVAYSKEEQVCRRPGGRQREHGAAAVTYVLVFFLTSVLFSFYS